MRVRFAGQKSWVTSLLSSGFDSRNTREVANFVPESANAGVTYRYKGFGARMNMNYSGDTLRVYSASEAQRTYQPPRYLVNAGVSYRLNKSMEFSCDITNLFNRPQERYRYIESRPSTRTYNGTSMTFSVSGSF